MSKIAIYPGSFDPLTLGHLSVLRRASKLFDEVLLAIVHNPSKTPHYSLEARSEAISQAMAEAGIENCEVVEISSGLLVDSAARLGATAIVKGFRNSADIDYELPMSEVNRNLGQLETVFIPAAPEHGFVSSSLVRQVFDLGGDVTSYVPESVLEMMQKESK